MRVAYKKYTDQEVIDIVNNYMNKYPMASRSKILTYSEAAGSKRICELEAKGLIKLPDRRSASRRDNSWKKYTISPKVVYC